MSAKTVIETYTKNQERASDISDAAIQKEIARTAVHDSIDGFELFEIDARAFEEQRAEMKIQLIGKDEPVDAIFDQLTLYETRPDDDYRPAASFAFVGPEGVGKKKTADMLGRVIGDGSGDNVIIIDCYNYLDSSRIPELISTIAHFVVNNEESYFSGLPSNVVVFENFEDATLEMRYWMLQILDGIELPYRELDTETGDQSEGFVDWRSSIVAFTCHTSSSILGFRKGGEIDSGVGPLQPGRDTDSPSTHFKQIAPEFHKRINKEVKFRKLNADECSEVFDLYIEERNEEFVDHYGVYISLDDGAKQLMLALASKEEPGAGTSALRKVFTEKVQRRVSIEILNETIEPGTEVRVFEREGQLVFGSRPDASLIETDDDEDGFPDNVVPGLE